MRARNERANDPWTPAGRVAAAEGTPLAPGDGERFSGDGIMGQPFRSGHVLALRRFSSSSIGPGYTSVWHADPEGRWTMWADVSPHQACARYFGPVLAGAERCAIDVEWPDPWTVDVRIGGVLEWRTPVRRTPATAAVTALASRLPAALCRSDRVLALMGRVAGPMLGAGAIRLHGRVPSEHMFKVNPRYVWAAAPERATLFGEPLGEAGPTAPQRRLGEFWVPNRGLFVVGQATFTR